MNQKLRIAICQFPVSCNISNNAKFIHKFINEASSAGAQVIHFPETALSGYGRSDFSSSNIDNWHLLEEHMKEIANLADKHNIWIVLGSCQKVAESESPFNCIQVVSDKGQIVGTYNKQKLTESESAWYTPGNKVLTVTINSIKCGFLICYEACFPQLFETYRKKGVQLIFHSCHNVSSKPKPLFQELTLAQIRTRAADNQMWISDSNSSSRYSFSTTCIARPDGSIRSLKKHCSGILLHDFPDTEIGWTYDNREK